MKLTKLFSIIFISLTAMFAQPVFADPNHCDINDRVKWEKHLKECGPYPEPETTISVPDIPLPETGSGDRIAIAAGILVLTGGAILLMRKL